LLDSELYVATTIPSTAHLLHVLMMPGGPHCPPSATILSWIRDLAALQRTIALLFGSAFGGLYILASVTFTMSMTWKHALMPRLFLDRMSLRSSSSAWRTSASRYISVNSWYGGPEVYSKAILLLPPAADDGH
jgi:hypothetical protein